MEIEHQTRIRPKVYTVAKFAQVFATSPHRVRDLIHKGKIPALRIGRSYGIPRKAAAEFLARALPPTVRTGNRLKTSVLDDQTGYLFSSPTTH